MCPPLNRCRDSSSSHRKEDADNAHISAAGYLLLYGYTSLFVCACARACVFCLHSPPFSSVNTCRACALSSIWSYHMRVKGYQTNSRLSKQWDQTTESTRQIGWLFPQTGRLLTAAHSRSVNTHNVDAHTNTHSRTHSPAKWCPGADLHRNTRLSCLSACKWLIGA